MLRFSGMSAHHLLILTIVAVLVPAASRAERLTSVLIFPIRVSGVSLGDSQNLEIRNYLGTRLTMEAVYRVMPESQIRVELGSAKLASYNDCYDEACRINLTKTVMADKSLSVEVVKEEEYCRVTGNLYDIAQEVTETAADVVCGCSVAEIKKAMVTVAKQLSGKVVVTQPSPTEFGSVAPGKAAAVARGSEYLPPVREERGFLVVEGAPKGARVEIVGPSKFGDRGKVVMTLPVRSMSVPAGKYIITVSQPGYGVKEVQAAVYADATETVKIDLGRDFGEIILSGSPEGARCHLECQKGFVRDFGMPGQELSLSVPPGSCRLTVLRSGYQPYDEWFDVSGDGAARQTVHLKRIVADFEGGSAAKSGDQAAAYAPRDAEGVPVSRRTAWMTQGADTLPEGRRAFELSVGTQALVLGFHVPASSRAEVNPYFTLNYLGYGSWVPGLADALGLQLKFNLWRGAHASLSLGLDFGLAVRYPVGSVPIWAVAVPFNFPELRYSYRWDSSRVAFSTGLRMPVSVVVFPSPAYASIPLLVFFGVEHNVTAHFNVFGKFEIGPDIFVFSATDTGGLATFVTYALGVQFGMSFLW